MPRNKANADINKEAQVEGAASTPSLPQLTSVQLRTLLNALMRSPVGVVQQVGYLLMLFVSVVKSNVASAGAETNRPLAVTNEESQQAAIVVNHAKGRLQKVRRRGNKRGAADGPTAKDVRVWAVKGNQRVQRLLQCLQHAGEIGLDDAMLVRHYAEKIPKDEAHKVLYTT